MNRQIKFRIWDKETKSIISKFEFPNPVRCFIGDSEVSAPYFPSGDSDGYVYQQWTGLLDKNEVEIYEGDIVNFENDKKPYVVEFQNGRFIGSYCSKWNAESNEMVFGVVNPDFYDFKEVFTNIKDESGVLSQIPVLEFLPISTVIGNIHQNPELLNAP